MFFSEVTSHQFFTMAAFDHGISIGVALLDAFVLRIFLALWFMYFPEVASHWFVAVLAVCLCSIAIGGLFRSVGVLLTAGLTCCLSVLFAFQFWVFITC